MTAAASLPIQSGPNQLGRGPGARAGHSRVLPGTKIAALRREFETATPLAFLAVLISADAPQRARRAAADKLRAAVANLLTIAANKKWSSRRTAKVAGLTRASWQRIQTGSVDPAKWLPRLETALAKLNPS